MKYYILLQKAIQVKTLKRVVQELMIAWLILLIEGYI
jgi:hypothetical protein